MKRLFLPAVILIGLAVLIYGFKVAPPNLPTAVPGDESQEAVVAENLNIPWEIDWLPDGTMIVTERPGRLLLIGKDKQTIEVNGVAHVGEGGLLGLALHPNFNANHWLYLYLTTGGAGNLSNRVERYELNGRVLSNRAVILDGINGKILRINDDGSGREVYSYGHRNPQGLAWDGQGRLWATEHGPSGADTGWDEVNLIEAGNNYGWPEIKGDQAKAGMVKPVIQSGSDDTWAPSGMAIVGDRLLFAGLRGEAIYSGTIAGNKLVDFSRHFTGQWGRIRTIKLGPDGWFYILTNNRDGRGKVGPGDDKTIRIEAKQLLDK